MIFNEGVHNKNWETKKLSELGSFGRGVSKYRPRNDKSIFENGSYPFIQTGDVKGANLYINTHSENYNDLGLKQSKVWAKETLCITIAANIAETALLGYPMCFPDSIVGFNAYIDKTSELFMYYVFIYIRKSIQNSANGSIQDNINIDYLKNLNFKIPKKEYQDKIIKVLSNLDKKINLNNKINKELEEMAKAIYIYKFIKKETNGKIQDILLENSKSTIKAGEAKLVKGKHPFFTSGNAILEWDEALVTGRNCYLNTGGNADVKFYIGEAAYSTDTWCISARDSMSDYLFLLLKTIKPELEIKFFEGTGLRHLQKSLLKQRDIYIPTENEIESFNKKVQPLFNLIIKNRKENKELESIRDWLLPMLMNGQVIIK